MEEKLADAKLDTIEVGDRVMIKDLNSLKDFNGTFGVIHAWESAAPDSKGVVKASGGRWKVMCEYDGQIN